MSLIRWGQTAITRVTPHANNARFLIPAREPEGGGGGGGALLVVDPPSMLAVAACMNGKGYQVRDVTRTQFEARFRGRWEIVYRGMTGQDVAGIGEPFSGHLVECLLEQVD